MSRRVRTGLIGCGKIAATHAQALRTIEAADLVACSDLDEGRAWAFAAAHEVPRVFPDPTALLRSGEVEAVLVCTPHPAHAPVVVAAAEAGVHVLCEKPIAVDLAEADRMVEAAARAGIAFGVVFQRRF